MLRTIKNLKRNPTAAKVRVIQTIVVAILLCWIFWDLGTKGLDVRGKTGFLFFVSVNQTMTAMYSVLLLFIVERPVFLREYSNKTYGIITYFISKSVIEVPFQFIFPVIFSTIIYFSVGMRADIEHFFTFVFILISDCLFGTSVGFLFGSIFHNPSKAATGWLLIMLPYFIFAGYLVNLENITIWLRWITYVSPIRYSLEALLRNEMEDNPEYSSESKEYERFHFNLTLPFWIGMLLTLSLIIRLIALVGLRATVARVQ